MSKDYFKKLKDPRWQKKRLQILERDNWECKLCGLGDKTLHVHHKSYNWGKDPWDYPDENLITVCEECHELEDRLRKETKDVIKDTLQATNLTNSDIVEIFESISSCYKNPTGTSIPDLQDFMNSHVMQYVNNRYSLMLHAFHASYRNKEDRDEITSVMEEFDEKVTSLADQYLQKVREIRKS